MARMLIVDGMSVLKTVGGSAAFLTNGYSYNFFTQLTATIRKFENIKGVIVCWEGGYDHRSKIFAGYKAHRADKESKTQGEFRSQRSIVQELLRHVGVDQVMAPGYEGDDVGAWLVHNLGVPMVLYSNDQDWLQLVKPGVSIYQKAPRSVGKQNLRVEIEHSTFEHYTGYPSPEEFLKCKCIIGDDGDIGPQSGLVGVGAEGIKAWIYNLPMPETKRTKINEFLESEKYARNRMLIDLITPRLIEDIKWNRGELNEEKAMNFLVDYKWPSIVKKFPEWWATYAGAVV